MALKYKNLVCVKIMGIPDRNGLDILLLLLLIVFSEYWFGCFIMSRYLVLPFRTKKVGRGKISLLVRSVNEQVPRDQLVQSTHVWYLSVCCFVLKRM